MTTHAIHIPARYLAALKTFNDPNLPSYLQGVQVEITSDAIYLIATNKRILCAYHQNAENPTETQGTFNIPPALLEHVRSTRKLKDTLVEIQYAAMPKNMGREFPIHGYDITITFAGHAASGTSIDTILFDWRRQFPTTTSGQPGQFDTRLLAKLTKIIDALRPGADICIGISHNGKEGPALLDFDDENFIGALMPYRLNGYLPTEPPTWALPR